MGKSLRIVGLSLVLLILVTYLWLERGQRSAISAANATPDQIGTKEHRGAGSSKIIEVVPSPPTRATAKEATETHAPIAGLPPLVGSLAAPIEKRREDALRMTETLMGPLLRQMSLTPEQLVQVLNILAAHRTSIEQTLIDLHNGAPPATRQMLDQINAERDDALEGLLGASDAQTVLELVSTRVERNMVSSLSDYLASRGQPLTEDQQEAVLTALVPVYRAAKVDPAQMVVGGANQRRMNALEAVIRNRPAPFSSEQVRIMQEFITSQKEGTGP